MHSSQAHGSWWGDTAHALFTQAGTLAFTGGPLAKALTWWSSWRASSAEAIMSKGKCVGAEGQAVSPRPAEGGEKAGGGG